MPPMPTMTFSKQYNGPSRLAEPHPRVADFGEFLLDRPPPLPSAYAAFGRQPSGPSRSRTWMRSDNWHSSTGAHPDRLRPFSQVGGAALVDIGCRFFA